MRFLKATTFYPTYLRQFHGRHPLLSLESFERQRAHLFEDCFGWSDFFQHPLETLGYQTHELVINSEHLQRAWAVEHGGPVSTDDWMFEIAFAQIERFDPEILFLDDTATFPRAWIERVRAASPSLRLVVGWSGAPSTHMGALAAYDAVLSCVPELVSELRNAGKRAFHLHHGFEPRVLERMGSRVGPPLDFSFVGQMAAGSAFHEERQRMLCALAECTPLRIYSPSGDQVERAKRYLKPLLKSAAAILDDLPMPRSVRSRIPLPPAGSAVYEVGPDLPTPLVRRLNPPVFGLDMFRLLRDSRTTFNCHLGASRRSASNMRLFEATGVGTCLVTDMKDNLAELFTPDEEVVTYRSLDECIEKVEWLIANPVRARAIGLKGQARTLRDHSYAARAARLDELLRGLLA